MKSDKPTPLTYFFVIVVFIIGALFIMCNANGKMRKIEARLTTMSSDDARIDYLIAKLHEEYNIPKDRYDNIPTKPEKIQRMKSTLNYNMEEDANGIATYAIMGFFVLIAIGVSVIKYVGTVMLGFRSAKNIARRM